MYFLVSCRLLMMDKNSCCSLFSLYSFFRSCLFSFSSTHVQHVLSLTKKKVSELIMLMTRGQQQYDARLKHLYKSGRTLKERRNRSCTSSTVARIAREYEERILVFGLFLFLNFSQSLSLCLAPCFSPYDCTRIIPTYNSSSVKI